MLKITITREDACERVLKLEGKLLADWVGELLDVCRQASSESLNVRLDLGGLTFVDIPGTAALRDLIRRGVHITTPSPLVGELLKES